MTNPLSPDTQKEAERLAEFARLCVLHDKDKNQSTVNVKAIGHEIAAALQSAKDSAGVERLREALEKIGDHNRHGWTLQTEMAQEALSAVPAQQPKEADILNRANSPQLELPKEAPKLGEMKPAEEWAREIARSCTPDKEPNAAIYVFRTIVEVIQADAIRATKGENK